jgi:hypothetical protein
MGKYSLKGVAWSFAFVAGVAVSSSASAACVGNCGSSSAADGVVTLPPSSSSYSWISTNGGQNGAGQLSGIGGTNGSSYTTSPFHANAGDPLQYYFNYVTSDGAGFADYAWVQLLDANTSNPVATLLTARTEPSGNIIPGVGLPSIDATLTPSSVPIIGGGPSWSPLGSTYSGACFAAGCGYTGWVKSDFNILASGNYILALGVTNWIDTIFDSGLAFAGITVAGNPIENVVDNVGATPLPTGIPLFATGLGLLGLLGWRRKRKNAALAVA